MVHFGSKTEDAHCGVSIAWSLKKIIKKVLSKKNYLYYYNFCLSWKMYFFQFWQFLATFWTILANMVHFGSKIEDAHCGDPVARSLFYEEQIEWIGFLLHTYNPRLFSLSLLHRRTLIKFMFSKNATKIDQIFTVDLTFTK